MSVALPVLVTRDGAVGVIELARPDKFNCLSSEVHRLIDSALEEFKTPSSGVRAILVRAQGQHFCTGADLSEFKRVRANPESLREFVGYGHKVLRQLETCELPVVAACQGLALAGGTELMLACDVVFASADAKFGDQHARYGLVPGWGGSQRFTRVVGVRRAIDLLYSARWVDAKTALEWGLVNYVVEPDKLQETALDYCRKLSTRSRKGLALMKRLAREGADNTLPVALKLEEDLAVAFLQSDDVTEGLAAFEERREPRFGSGHRGAG